MVVFLENNNYIRFPESLYQKIQRPRQTYFCLQVNKVRARLTMLEMT